MQKYRRLRRIRKWERIFNDAKDKHRQMLTGTCIFIVLSKVSKVLCTEYYVFNYRY